MTDVATHLDTPAAAAEAEHHIDVKKHVRVYLAVFGALAVLTIVTVAVGYLRLPILPAVVVGLLIATVKAGLVAGYFMHLISEKKVIYTTLVLTVGLVLFMFALFIMSHADQEGGFLAP